MGNKLWLLVEWVDESSAVPAYGVVSSDSLINEDKQLHPGKMIYVKTKYGNSAQKAQVLKISGNKQLIKDNKKLLERRDHQVRKMLTMCMRTIKDIKTEPLIFDYGANSNSQINDGASGSGITKTKNKDASNDSSSDGDSDDEVINEKKQKQPQLPKFNSDDTIAKFQYIAERLNEECSKLGNPNSISREKKQEIFNSISASIDEMEIPNPTTVDQATQTEIIKDGVRMVWVPAHLIEKFETTLNTLYDWFCKMLDNVYIIGDENSDDQNGEENEEIDEDNERPDLNDSAEANARSLEVRRVSAHTTNNIEQNSPDDDDMVPIGLGYAKVPARVLNDMDWGVYSTATRQLLQAIFPRKVLATHSLTGKKSPAFMNLPAKKRLDPKKIHDIVDTVSQRCGVPKNLVRSCITVKCTDESKLYRNRRGRAAQAPENQENHPPSLPPSSATSPSSNE